ncbi:MAG: hypothetical protein ACTSRU_03610 [Candidatus Hodarchaeales archaeon]
MIYVLLTREFSSISVVFAAKFIFYSAKIILTMLVDHPKRIKQKMTTMIQWIAYYPAVTTVLVKRMSLTFVCTFLHEKSIILSRNILLAEYFQRIIAGI